MSLGKNTIWFISLYLIKYLGDRHNEATVAATRALAETGITITRTRSRAASIHESLCGNRISFTRRAVCKVGAVGAAVVHARVLGVGLALGHPTPGGELAAGSPMESVRFFSFGISPPLNTAPRPPCTPYFFNLSVSSV